jgi:predicted SprT family Zn-dependent metalloprotease
MLAMAWQSCIIGDMDRKQLTKILNNQTAIIWDNLCELYPRLTKYNPPIIKINGRLWRTAGLCHQEDNIIELGFKFFTHSKAYSDNMFDIILPHEIIHQADYNLFGLSEKNCGHGVQWQKIMVQYGLEPNPHHTMEILR